MKVPGMYVNLKSVNFDSLEKHLRDIAIRSVDTESEEELGAYTDIMIRAFQVGGPVREPLERFTYEFQRYPNSSHYLVISDNQPVACASVIYCAGVAGVYNVATLPEYQRKGFATALMVTIMKEARDKGYQYSILHSSDKGKYVYEQLGYKVKFWFKRYLLRPKDVGL